MLAAAALVAGAVACGDDGQDRGAQDQGGRDGSVEPTGDLVADVADVGAVYGGTVTNVGDLHVTASEAHNTPASPPVGVTDVGPGLHVEVDGAPQGRLELRLRLPTEPDGGAIPGVLHVHDDGTVTVQPGLFDPVSNEIVLWVSEFSDFFGGWWNPANWVEEVFQVGQGAWDAVADWMTGRTDPPPCGDAPPWARVQTSELSSVHVCLQANPADDGTERAELFVKSNRNTAQLITLPAGADYVWVENQPDWMRGPLVEGFNVGNADPVDGDTHVVLLGGQSMSVGFRQPEVSTSVDMLAYRTWPMVIINPVLGLLGGIEGNRAEAMMLAVQACVHDVAGIEIARLDIWPAAYDSRLDFVGSMAKCAFELAQHPDIAIAGFDEMLRGAGLSAADRNRVLARLRTGLDQVEATAGRLAKALIVGAVTTNAWDNAFDTLADGRITVAFTGRRTPPLSAESLLSAPVPSLCDHPAGTLVDGRLPGIPETAGGVWLYRIGWTPDDGATASQLGALGDVTGDGQDDAVVTLGCYQGGVSWPDTVHVYTAGPAHQAELRLADLIDTGWEHRESVLSVAVSDDGTFTLEWITHAPGDAMCCGSLTMRGTFTVDGDQVKVASLEVIDDARLAAPELAPGSYPDVPACREGAQTATSDGPDAASAAAMCFYTAFALSERETAALYADPGVVDDFFQSPWPVIPQDWRFHGCNEQSDDGSVVCTFTVAADNTVVDLTLASVGDRFAITDAYIGEDLGD
jgi:hypothetical protein